MSDEPRPLDPDARLVARAAADETFRQALLTDTKATIERELGVTIPEGKQVVVLAESASVHYLVLPLPASGELSDGELDSVGGGAGAVGYQTWMTTLKSTADSKGQVQGELARFR